MYSSSSFTQRRQQYMPPHQPEINLHFEWNYVSYDMISYIVLRVLVPRMKIKNATVKCCYAQQQEQERQGCAAGVHDFLYDNTACWAMHATLPPPTTAVCLCIRPISSGHRSAAVLLFIFHDLIAQNTRGLLLS